MIGTDRKMKAETMNDHYNLRLTAAVIFAAAFVLTNRCAYGADTAKPEYAAVEAQLRAHLADWMGRTPDEGKKALSAAPAGTRTRNRGTNQ
jgi:hypothetical protein